MPDGVAPDSDLWVDELEWLLIIAELNWSGYLYYKDANC